MTRTAPMLRRYDGLHAKVDGTEILRGMISTWARRRWATHHGPQRVGQETCAQVLAAARVRGHQGRGALPGQGPARASRPRNAPWRGIFMASSTRWNPWGPANLSSSGRRSRGPQGAVEEDLDAIDSSSRSPRRR